MMKIMEIRHKKRWQMEQDVKQLISTPFRKDQISRFSQIFLKLNLITMGELKSLFASVRQYIQCKIWSTKYIERSKVAEFLPLLTPGQQNTYCSMEIECRIFIFLNTLRFQSFPLQTYQLTKYIAKSQYLFSKTYLQN